MTWIAVEIILKFMVHVINAVCADYYSNWEDFHSPANLNMHAFYYYIRRHLLLQ